MGKEVSMKNIHIGKRNASYQQLQGLKENRTKRLRQRAFFVEGVRNINQAIATGWKIRSFIYSEGELSDWLFLTGHGVDLYDPEVLQASMGSFFRVPVWQMERSDQWESCVAALRTKYPALRLVGTTAHREQPLYRQPLSGPVVIMLGNETMGLSHRYKEMADVLCSIPMAQTSSASSLNVGCAASILLYEAARQRSMGQTFYGEEGVWR